MDDFILTISGRMVAPLNPDPNQIRIEDIAHSLSHLCRASGHLIRYYSVAEHCVYCYREARARGYTPKVQLACLMHDGAEAYLGDLIRPIKKLLPEYSEYEKEMQKAIAIGLNLPQLTPEEEQLVVDVDNTLFYHEFITFHGTKMYDQPKEIYVQLALDMPDPKDVRAEFLRIYEKLTSRL